MATITAYQNLTLAEVVKRAGYDEDAAVLGEIAKKSDFLNVMPFLPASHGNYNEALQATRLGSGQFGQVNGALPSMASAASPVQEPVKMYEGESRVDERALKGVMDPYLVRDSEDAMNFEGMIQGFVDAIIYKSMADSLNGLKGFMARRSALGKYCVSGAGTGSDLSSVLLMELGPSTLHLAYPSNGTVPGILNEDRGRHLVDIPAGTGQMWAWIRHYEIWAAIVLRNERALLRYANIETSGSSNIFSATTFINLKNQLPSAGRNAVAFASRSIKGQIEADAYNKANAAYSIADIEGFGPVARVAAVPVLLEENLLDTETAVV